MIIGFGSKEHLIQLRNEGERERRKENKNKKDVGKKKLLLRIASLFSERKYKRVAKRKEDDCADIES